MSLFEKAIQEIIENARKEPERVKLIIRKPLSDININPLSIVKQIGISEGGVVIQNKGVLSRTAIQHIKDLDFEIEDFLFTENSSKNVISINLESSQFNLNIDKTKEPFFGIVKHGCSLYMNLKEWRIFRKILDQYYETVKLEYG